MPRVLVAAISPCSCFLTCERMIILTCLRLNSLLVLQQGEKSIYSLIKPPTAITEQCYLAFNNLPIQATVCIKE